MLFCIFKHSRVGPVTSLVLRRENVSERRGSVMVEMIVEMGVMKCTLTVMEGPGVSSCF